MFESGAVVRLKNNPSRAGTVTGRTRVGHGSTYWEVRLADGGGLQWLPQVQLVATNTAPDPFVDLASGRFTDPALLRRLLLHYRLNGRLRDVIYSMDVSDTEFHAYQFKPVVKILSAPSQGLLIADEVGLGKTIEAGLVWTELMARFDSHRLLVICPKSLTEKWRQELWQKFSVDARIVDADDLLLHVSREALASDGFALIASLPSVRPPKGWDDDNEDDSSRAQLARFLAERQGEDPLFDCVIFDEAHHLRNADTLNHQFARLAMDVSDYKLLLSATPINLRSEDLRNLLKLLDPETFENAFTFDLLAEENKPLVAARDSVLNPKVPFAEILSELHSLPRGELLKIDRQLESLQNEIRSGVLTDTPTTRTRIAAQLEEMSLLGSVVNRTRRRDVNEFHVKRDVTQLRWEMNELERDFYVAVSDAVREHAWTRAASERFLLATPQRLLASSLAAACKHWMGTATAELLDDPDEDVDKPGVLSAKLGILATRMGQLAALTEHDTKSECLRKAILQQQAAGDQKLIVFSSFRITLDYLADRLAQDGIPTELMHGGLKEARTAIIARFEKTEGPCVLLTSEVGGEGLDMQFCRALINYDLPWNPMKVEQRIGRIDRIGQKAQRITVMSMIAADTIEEQIYERLYLRLMTIEQSLGAFEAILGPEIRNLEQRLLDPKLTDEEREDEIERSALALETRHNQTLELEEQAPGLIAHGDMILAQIAENHRPERRVSAADLVDYVHEAISKRYPGSEIVEIPSKPGIYEVRLSAAAHLDLKAMMKKGARARTRLTRHARVEAAFERTTSLSKSVELVSAVHPLVRFAVEIRKHAAAGVQIEPVVHLSIDRSQTTVPPGRYVAAAASWTVSSSIDVHRLAYAAARVGGNSLDAADSESLLHLALREGQQLAGSVEATDIGALRHLCDVHLTDAFEVFVGEEEARHYDRADTGIARLKRQHAQRTRETEERLKAWKMSGDPKKLRMIPAAQGKLNNLLAHIRVKMDGLEAARDAFSFGESRVGLAVIVVA
jgi:superfamily II DNA or RNA helicase